MEAIAAEAGGKPIEVWFADEARIGQKNKITRRWARRGTRPSAPHDQRTASTYIFGAICPAKGKGAGLVLPRCTTQAMALHLAEIATMVAPGAHSRPRARQGGMACLQNARRSFEHHAHPLASQVAGAQSS